ncbi:MAG: 16S rRNA (cytidine(1402)-2'-O)-methyltransferase [Anaerolineae bacterium]|nr:16S rRNA (cytidine(1402)-2'-O)-methyltransferase [Anaerolineae bacterium]
MGTLYLVGTPIGNLEDISLRALRVLKEVTLIAAEDTRRARILTTRYDIRTPVTSYFEGNKLVKLEAILGALDEGDVALISEAGMPGLSDPGYELVCAAIARGYPVTCVPGPSAPVTALVLSGLPTDSFVYLGFLPRRRRERLALLTELAGERRTLIAFEAPHRLHASLADLESTLGDRPVAVCRELTKLHEEVWRGTISAARHHFGMVPLRGEITLVIGGAVQADRRWDTARVEAALSELLAQGMSRSAAARRVAEMSGWSRAEVYALGLNAPER